MQQIVLTEPVNEIIHQHEEHIEYSTVVEHRLDESEIGSGLIQSEDIVESPEAREEHGRFGSSIQEQEGHQSSKMSFDPAVEAFNIAAFLKADCLASIEQESKNDPPQQPTPNITRFDIGKEEVESSEDASQQTHRVEPPKAIHCKSKSMIKTENQHSVTNSYDSITEVQKHHKSNIEELQKTTSRRDNQMSMDASIYEEFSRETFNGDS